MGQDAKRQMSSEMDTREKLWLLESGERNVASCKWRGYGKGA